MSMWTGRWLLALHPDKCYYMQIGNSEVWDLGYNLRWQEPEHRNNEKDLGIIIDKKLNF